MLTPRRTLPALLATIIVATSACGGGGSASAPGGASLLPVAPSGPTVAASTKLGVKIAAAPGGALPFVAKRSSQAANQTAAGQPVTVTYNGAVVGTGTLDSNGFVDLTFTQNVPAGATVTVTVGSGAGAITATVTLATASSSTASEIVYNPGPPPSITVTSAGDVTGSGAITPGAPQEVSENENPSSGQPTSVNSSSDDQLPTNLPVSITTCGGSVITIAPNGTQTNGPWTLSFEEKVSDSDNSPKFEYETAAFSGPLTFPELASAARIELVITDSTGALILALEAPLNAVTNGSPTAVASPTPGASATPSAAPSAVPSGSPAPTATPSAAPSPTACPTLSPSAPGGPTGGPTMPPMPTPPAEPTDTPEPTDSPEPTDTPMPTAAPSPAPSASPTASPSSSPSSGPSASPTP